MSVEIDIRIMGVPERMDNILASKELLVVPDENIFIDHEHIGCKWNAARAWLKETDKSHVMVLQDDVEFCDDFMKYLQITVDLHPDHVITLFPFRFRQHKELGRYPATPYVETDLVSGCGVVMRKEYVVPCVNSWTEEVKGDDTNIKNWAEANGIRILTTIPSLIQHVDGGRSVFNPERALGGTVTFLKDVSGSRWENGTVTNWSTLKR